METLCKRATSVAHLTNFFFQFFCKIFTEDASLPLLYHGAKMSKMTKNSNQGGCPALNPRSASPCNVFTQPMIVLCTLYFTFRNSLASSLHSIYGLLLLITISVLDLILYSSAILDTPSTIKHEPALCSMALLLLHFDSFDWSGTQYLTLATRIN